MTLVDATDLASGPKRILRDLDPARLKPFLVLSLRLGQRCRLGQAGLFGCGRGHLDHARHFLGSECAGKPN